MDAAVNSRKGKGRAYKALLFLLFAITACGKGGDNATGSITYHLEQAATSTTTNNFILNVEGEFKPAFSLSGTGFTAGVPLDTMTPFQESTTLTAETFGEVTIDLTLYQENGKAYLTDHILWKSSGEVPPKPKVYFSEAVTADSYVYLVFPKDRGKNTTEVWVEGDLAPAVAAGKYYTIPSDDQLLIEIAPKDGMKTIHLKYRNIFGAHSEMIELSILRKGQGPVDCKAIPVASRTATGTIRTRIQATNEGPLFFKVTGDVAIEKEYAPFTDTIDDFIDLTNPEGVKHITVKIKDEAGNACPDQKLTIAYDSTYRPGSLAIRDNLLWTDDPTITILPHFDHLEGDVMEMRINGGLTAAANIGIWIPYSEEITLVLSPTNGTRHIAVEFRKEMTTLSEVSVSLFLRPFILISGSGMSRFVSPGNIIGASSLSITGCIENYDHVAYQANFACTPQGAQASVTYDLTDGTQITRSQSF